MWAFGNLSILYPRNINYTLVDGDVTNLLSALPCHYVEEDALETKHCPIVGLILRLGSMKVLMSSAVTLALR